MIVQGCAPESSEPYAGMTADYWKNQTIYDIVEPWTDRALDREKNWIPAYMDRDWTSVGSDHIYPGMYSRHIFSYSAAYLISGEQQYLDIASELTGHLLDHGWDDEYGLWYNELDNAGNPVDMDKGMFMQLYAVTGLSMYYAVTRDENVFNYIQNSIDLLEEYAWDHEYEGYINSLKRNLSIDDDNKRTTPQVAPVSGYLAYLYPILRDSSFLQMKQRGLDVVTRLMIDPETGWLLGSYDRNWQLNREASNRVNIGHNVEMVWLLLRLHLLTGDDIYKEQAQQLYDQLFEIAFHPETGAWYHWFELDNPNNRIDQVTWWVHAYGNMTELYMYRVTKDPRHLARFEQGARFWNKYFIDQQLGGTYLSVGLDGSLQRGDKATRSKTSYHSVEHGLLNYLYLSFWVEKKPVTLYYKINSSKEGDIFYPHLIEDLDITIEAVRLEDQIWENFNPEEGFITLPSMNNTRLEVTLIP